MDECNVIRITSSSLFLKTSCSEKANLYTQVVKFGEMAEWPNAVVLKTIEPKGSGGSNPSLSATTRRSRRIGGKRAEMRTTGFDGA